MLEFDDVFLVFFSIKIMMSIGMSSCHNISHTGLLSRDLFLKLLSIDPADMPRGVAIVKTD